MWPGGPSVTIRRRDAVLGGPIARTAALIVLTGLLALLALSVGAGAPDAGQAAAKPKFEVRLLTKSQRGMLRKSRVRVQVQTKRRMRLRVAASLKRTGTKPRSARATKARIVKFPGRGSKKVKLKLNRFGRRELSTCRGHRLSVIARPKRGGKKRARASDIVRINLPKCDPSRGGGIVGGEGSGGGGGDGDGDGPGGGGRGGSRGTIDLTNADRCDFMDPAVCLYPWPNDHFTIRDESTDSDRRLNLHRDSMPKNREGKPIEPSDYNRNDGFSPGQKIITKVPGLEDQDAFNRTGAVPITDIGRYRDRRQPVVAIDTVTGQRHPIWAEVDANPASPADRTLIIRPATNFAEGRRYIIALRRLRKANGEFIDAHRGFAVYRDRVQTSEPKIESRRRRMEDIFTTLESAGIPRDDLYLAWDFTTASEKNLSERALTIRDDAFAQRGDTNLADLQVQGTAPQYIVRSVQENPNGNIARRIDGSYFVPCYLDQPGCPPGSKFAYLPTDTHGPPRYVPGNMMEARFRCQIPKSAVDGPPARPALYGHGLLGSRDEVGAGNVGAMGNEHNIMFCATDWVGMACPDIPDPPTDQEGFEEFLQAVAEGRQAPPTHCDYGTIISILNDASNFPKLADRVQQGLVNFLYLGRLMVHPQGFNADPQFTSVQGTAITEPLLDTRRLFYDGNSQGGIIGGALAAVAVDHDRAVLGVPGMNYSTLLRRSVDFDAYAHGNFQDGVPDTPLGMYDAYPNELERPLLLSMIQILWDRAEANGYAHHMTKDPLANTPPHEVLLHVALGDHQVAQVSAEVEARTIGAFAREPYADPGRDSDTPPIFDVPAIPSYPFNGSAIVLWDSGPPRLVDGRCRGTPVPPTTNTPPRECEDPHSLPRAMPNARQQKSEFMRIDGSVVDVCGARPCYAGSWTGP